jgi:hypothetical protein
MAMRLYEKKFWLSSNIYPSDDLDYCYENMIQLATEIL